MTKIKEDMSLKRKYPLEDMAMKTAAQYFGKELLPYLGIREELKYIAPTENIHLEVRQMYQDFNYILKNGSWLHLEFESDSVKKEDLQRFREYEASTSRAYKVEVCTYVICSSTVQNPLTELKTGINTYKIRVIRLKDKNADRVFERLLQKMQRGKALNKKDMIQVVLSPLMSGSSSEKERILNACKILKNEENRGKISRDEIEKLRAVIYAFAVKFLEKEELVDVKEAFKMTVLGEMIWADGLMDGEVRKVISLICKKLRKGQPAVQIADALEEDVAYVENICNIAQKYAPDYDVDKIFQEVEQDRSVQGES